MVRGKKERQPSTSRLKVKPAETVTMAMTALETATSTQRSSLAAASAHPDGRARTAKQKGAKQKDFREPPVVEKKVNSSNAEIRRVSERGQKSH